MKILDDSETLAYHATRLLIIISYCGKPQSKDKLPGIEGRTLLAKLDFFLRYPAYLKKAAEILNKEVSDEQLGLATKEDVNSVESHMVRYRYGPWDHVYYPALGYLIGKQLITIEQNGTRKAEIFRLTKEGQNVVLNISKHPSYYDLCQRAKTIYNIFNTYTGTRLKDFIYNRFPEVVSRKLGDVI